MKERKGKTLSWSDFPFLVCLPTNPFDPCARSSARPKRAEQSLRSQSDIWAEMPFLFHDLRQVGFPAPWPHTCTWSRKYLLLNECPENHCCVWVAPCWPLVESGGLGRPREAWCRRPPSALWWSPGLEGEAWSWGGHTPGRSMLFFGFSLAYCLTPFLVPLAYQVTVLPTVCPGHPDPPWDVIGENAWHQ